jgi:hypothetical protein
MNPFRNLKAYRRSGVEAALGVLWFVGTLSTAGGQPSVARQWNEELLSAIRADFARPTVHARNLCHVSVAMWDAWAAYDGVAETYLHHESAAADDVAGARAETISYACYRILSERFASSPGAVETLPSLDAKMASLGYDATFTSTAGDSPAALGNRIAATVLAFGAADGSNEAGRYENLFYEPVNPPLVPELPGNPDIVDPNRWQPLALTYFVDQGGNVILGGFPDFLGPEWGQVSAFALSSEDLTVYRRDGFDYWVFHDPGAPPYLGTATEDDYRWGFEMVSVWSSHLDPGDGVMWDISPRSMGNAPLPGSGEYESFYNFQDGGDWGTGYALNPVTGEPYEPQIVPRGDFARVLAEFWADGPDSETPPGHWFVIANYVSDHPLLVKRIGGVGPIVDDLEWDVKLYFALGGAMHDCAVAAWGIKGWYDYTRPISALRHLAGLGQSSDPEGLSYHPDGITLRSGLIEVVTDATTVPGGRHAHLLGKEGKIAVYAWRGPDFIDNPATDVAGVGWILAENWWPYQRPSFVTPPFAGYVSGHSTFSRAGAVILTLMTGSEYFPGGLGEFHCPRNEFLVFEEGPSVDITLQWATYRDASDQTSLSRIWGGIHPPADDIPGRYIGEAVGADAFAQAQRYFGDADSNPVRFRRGDVDDSGGLDLSDAIAVFGFLFLGSEAPGCMEAADVNNDSRVEITDGISLLGFLYLGGPPPVSPGPTSECSLDRDEEGSPGDLGCARYTSCE